jgi:hypothetical protein
MRTTVDIPDELYQQAESKAAREGIPMGRLIAQALRRALSEPAVIPRQRIAFPLHHSARPGTLNNEQVGAAEYRPGQQGSRKRVSCR